MLGYAVKLLTQPTKLFVPGMTFGQVVELPHGILVRDALNALHPRLDRLNRIFGRIKTIAQHMLENVFGRAPRLMCEFSQTAGISLR